MNNSIRIDPEFGVNPGMELCFFCNKPKGVILYGKMTEEMKKNIHENTGLNCSTGEAPKYLCLNNGPCSECIELMKQGIILISIQNGEEGKKNPYRTGGFIVVKEDAIKRAIISPELVKDILKYRFCFIPDTAWNMLGLPPL